MSLRYRPAGDTGRAVLSGRPWIALIGNPNCGKTAIFNLLTGLSQKVSNYPGVTVEKKIGRLHLDRQGAVEVVDLPGTYSLIPESLDERIVSEMVLEWIHGKQPPAAILSIVDASNLRRNLYLTSQMLDLGIPVVIALNMMDRVHLAGQKIEHEVLQEHLGAVEVVPMSATEGWGLKALKTALDRALEAPVPPSGKVLFDLDAEVEEDLQPLGDFLAERLQYSERIARVQALRLVTRKSALDLYRTLDLNGQTLSGNDLQQLEDLRADIIRHLGEKHHIVHRSLEAVTRYHHLDRIVNEVLTSATPSLQRVTRSEKFDRVLTHRWLGLLVFVTVLYFIFQSVFSWAAIPMEWIAAGFTWLGEFFLRALPPGTLRDLLVEGVISGVGSILAFLPQILILVFFLTLLEDSGYMARVVFLLDRFMTRVGLHGRSVLPLMSGYACAIPGILATRTIDSWKERLITILVIPLMSCSARLPVYALMIGTFIPGTKILGIFSLQALTFVIMYFLGTVSAFGIAKLLSRIIPAENSRSFVMELPPYRLPLLRSVLRQVYNRGKLFVRDAGRIIMAVSIILWFLATYPRPGNADSGPRSIQTSYAARIGHTIEPLIRPLGFDWKIGVGLLTSFAAREVIVSTMATLYNVEEAGENVVSLRQALRSEINPHTGQPRYTPLVAVSLMVFFVYAAQCMATFATVRHETKTWKWPLIMVAYMSGLAYLATLLVYQGGRLLGLAA